MVSVGVVVVVFVLVVVVSVVVLVVVPGSGVVQPAKVNAKLAIKIIFFIFFLFEMNKIDSSFSNQICIQTKRKSCKKNTVWHT